ncbi:MAG: hypothetical protein INH41_25300 [Myxococcaceae bacterium]|nr:hypothetical protein [Myxococcaceae bacterium]MCA3015716.1 hypothetical protein [Myxococcaceae bacterium]
MTALRPGAARWRLAWLLPGVVAWACSPGASSLDVALAPVAVAAASGPACLERCEAARASCGDLVPGRCAEACAAPVAEATRACLAARPDDCLEVAVCVRAPSRGRFRPGPYGTGVKDVAGPASLPTAEGTLRLEAQLLGDDSALFLFHASATAGLFAGSLRALLDASPRGVHYVFGPLDDVPAFEAVRRRWTAELTQLPEADRRHWLPRVHFLVAPVDVLEGWVGDMMRARRASPPRYLGNGLTAFAIDRQQRVREVGMLGRLGSGGVVPDLRLLAKEAEAFDFEYAREQRLAAEPGLRVVEVAARQTAWERLDADVVLPAGAELAGYDTLEVDLTMDCPEHLNATCGAWDYLSHLYLCAPTAGADGGADWRCDRELARWITTYWREGRWVTDISYQLAALAPGGPVHLRWTANGQFDPRRTEYITSLSLRFSKRGRPLRPVSATPLWTGGRLDLAYDGLQAPKVVMVPADAAKVELVTLLTGHGGVAPTNCAEFCNHEHLFSVNGVTKRRAFPEAQTADGCLTRVGEGVVPNQHGTWYFGRGGWCPGQDVAPVALDVTADVRKGQPNTFTYGARFGGRPITQHLGNVVLSSWLVVWR